MNIDGMIVLCMCIFSDNYIPPEKAYAMYRRGIPVSRQKRIWCPYKEWLTDDIKQEMINLAKEIGNAQACKCYGIHISEFGRIIKKITA